MPEQLALIAPEAPATPNLATADVILLNSSAGKDSQAMIDHVAGLAQDAGVLDRITVLHCDLGDVEWPGTSQHWFDLITWPGSLTIKGDMGSYTFSRDRDMLDFFRRSAWHGGPNLSYWEEKADAVDARAGIRAYSEDLLRQHIADDVTACAEKASTAYMDGLREELDDELLGEYPDWCLEDEGDALAGVRQFSYRPDDAPEPFTFDPSEWVVTDYAWHYVWCCHAIVWGIAAYDRAKTGQPAPLLVAAVTASVEG